MNLRPTNDKREVVVQIFFRPDFTFSFDRVSTREWWAIGGVPNGTRKNNRKALQPNDFLQAYASCAVSFFL